MVEDEYLAPRNVGGTACEALPRRSGTGGTRPLMRVTQRNRAARQRRQTRVWVVLCLGLLAMGLLVGCTARRTESASPTLIPVPTYTPTLPPTLAPTPTPTLPPTLAPTSTFTPTPTFTPTIVPSPTFIPQSVPSANQVADAVPGLTFEGDYANLAANREGQVHLAVQGRAVYATLQTVRSPVQYFAREQPEVLFTVPEGFRPATPMTWEVNGQHVGTDGQLDPVRRDIQVFRLSVDTEGQVRYVDDPGVDGVGFLRYHTTLAWPLAGTDPQVCARGPEIRAQIEAALHALAGVQTYCAQVSWEHLAGIETITYAQREAVKGEDWLGLSNVTSLALHSRDQATLPPDLLAHMPRLGQLSVTSRHMNALPAALLLYTSQLRQLTLDLLSGSTPFRDLPADLLTHTPHLNSLHLEIRYPAAAIARLLQAVPQLTHLTVGGLATPLSDTFLAAVPHLTDLRVDSPYDPCEAANLLAPVPQLAHFKLSRTVNAPQLICLADSLQAQAPNLSRLELRLSSLQDLTTDVLPGVPVTHLTIDLAGVSSLPADLLSQASHLTHLKLYDSSRRYGRGEGFTLPAGLLAGTPLLTEFVLDFRNLEAMPADLLAPVPRLQTLHFNVGRLPALPPGWLDPVTGLETLSLSGQFMKSISPGLLADMPQLRELEIHMQALDSLPADFLLWAPQLQSFALNAGGYHSNLVAVPEEFLAHTPSLTTLRLRVPRLQELPPTFLAHSPQLERLELEYNYGKSGKEFYALQSVPAHFLVDAPNLTYLDLGAIRGVQELPAEFLANSPQLKYLDLDVNVTALPADFLSQHPQLATVRMFTSQVTGLPHSFLGQSSQLESLSLDLKQVTALPSGFLTQTPRLHFLKLDVSQVGALPSGFLAHTPNLEFLILRAEQITALPYGFLAVTPQPMKTLGLGMPRLAFPPGPDHTLWPQLQAASYRVKIVSPDFQVVYGHSELCSGDDYALEVGDILEVFWREQGEAGHTVLSVFPWWDRDLFFTFYERHWCSFQIDARYTEPTLEV